MLGAPLHAEAPAFSDSGPIYSDTGYAMIGWHAAGPVVLGMRQGKDPASERMLYSGGNAAYFVSGLADGRYTFTLSNAAGEVSAPLELNVSHHPLAPALWLMGLGAVVFLLTVGVIFRGVRDD